MVVTIIIGIMVGLAVMSMNLIGNDRELQTQATRMSAVFDIITEEAQMQGRDYGIEFLIGGYRFVEYDPFLDVWNEVLGDDLLQPAQLAEGMEFELYIEDRRVLLQTEAQETEKSEDDADRDLTDDYLPHVLLMSSGDITPFELQLVRRFDNASIGLKLEPGGKLEVVSDDDDG